MLIFDTPEAKAALATAIEEATSGLKAKNVELLAELKKARKSAEITPEQLSEVEAERDKLQSDLQGASKATKDALKAAEIATKALEQETGFTQNLLVDNGLVGELTKNGVTNAAHLKAAQAMLRAGVQIVADGESRVAKFGEKSLSDYVKEWAGSDEGKHFVAAPVNSGGNAPGGGGKPQGKTMTRKEFDSKTAEGDTSLSAFFKEGGSLVE